MKPLIICFILGLIGFFLVSSNNLAWAAEAGTGLPPVAQPVVREGDFAIRLAETLGIGTTLSETEAESHLAEMGILPPNGWIADYPITPDTLDTLYKAVGEAADANRLPLSKEEALKKYSELTATLGLPIRPNEEAAYARELPQVDYGSYSDSSVISSYYYNQGPPLITYYTPPWDYYYIYRWVPYPFWWGQTWFGGFFILNDFYTFRKVVVVEKHGHRFVTHKRVTNHFYDREKKRFGRVDPFHRPEGYRFAGFRHEWNGRGFGEGRLQRGAESTFKRQSERAGLFRERQIGRREAFSSNFGNDRFRRGAPMPGIKSFGRNNGIRNFESSARPGRFSESQREMGRVFENRSNRFTREGLGTFGHRPRESSQFFSSSLMTRGGRELRNHSFSSEGSRLSDQRFSSGARKVGQGFSPGGVSGSGRFSGGGFSMSRSFGRGGRR
jgi:hypothetical protein